jgi:hypothetical protein
MDIDEIQTPDEAFQAKFDQFMRKYEEEANEITLDDFEDVFGHLATVKVGDMTALELMLSMAASKAKGYENNSFDDELSRLKKILGEMDAKVVPSSGQELVKWFKTDLVERFVKVVRLCYCEKGAFHWSKWSCTLTLFISH